ncbi:hypothetical protein BaRGS_00023928 [Batillaria attramentaria]|uniref:Uncharacterized protein n=1 Tax=Batillaria attramentaria TaxID=370345 RepID=A0ABD0KCQ1_9CAEN
MNEGVKKRMAEYRARRAAGRTTKERPKTRLDEQQVQTARAAAAEARRKRRAARAPQKKMWDNKRTERERENSCTETTGGVSKSCCFNLTR